VRIFARVAPQYVVSGLPLQKIRQLGRLFALIKQFAHRDFQGASHFLKCFDIGDRVSVFDMRNVTTEQSRLLLNVAL